MHGEAGPRPRAAATAAPVAAAPAAAAGPGLRGCPAAPRGLRVGRRPGLERRGFPRLGHPHAAPGCAGGRRGGPGQLLRAAAVHALAQPAAHRALSGTRWPPAPGQPGLSPRVALRGRALAPMAQCDRASSPWLPRASAHVRLPLGGLVLKWLSFSLGLRSEGFCDREVLYL